MTNTLTISREQLDRWAQMAEVFDDGGDGADPETAHTLAQELRVILSAPAVERQEEWAYCPECGCKDMHHEQGEHKQCANCYQEWFSDIDYSEVVRGNLEKLKASPPAPVAVVDENSEFEKWAKTQSEINDLRIDEIGLYYNLKTGIAHDAWQARACLDKVKEMN